MDKFIFGKLFTNEKNREEKKQYDASRHCDGNKSQSTTQENKGRPRAAVYIRLDMPYNVEKIMEYEKMKAMLYCDLHKYQIQRSVESASCSTALEDSGWKEIMKLAECGSVDVIVLPSLTKLSYCVEDIVQILDRLQECGTKVDCVGCGPLEHDFLERYVKESERRDKEVEMEFQKYMENRLIRNWGRSK